MTLTTEQQQAFDKILHWFQASSESFFSLQGFAGTGKTFLCQELVKVIKGKVCFTAPTNKAVRVLREVMTTKDYFPDCCTIYSLLGLQMVATGEVKVLSHKNARDPDLSSYRLVVVDEASMVSAILLKHLKSAAGGGTVKFLFLGDPAQLPPVKETSSPVWSLGCPEAKLTTVMRHDNQILEFVTKVREQVARPVPTLQLYNDHAEGEGVWALPAVKWEAAAKRAAQQGEFESGGAKIIAWRNVEVDRYNAMARREILRLGEGVEPPAWVAEDRVTFTAPAMDLEGDSMARTDDEGVVTRVTLDDHPTWPEFRVWRLRITLDTNEVIEGLSLAQESLRAWTAQHETLAAEARANPRRWKAFWEFKEAFHSIRHAYAYTAHRMQGSTCRTAFVDAKDILSNRNRGEAFRCLYVACSRPTTKLVLGGLPASPNRL